MGNREPIDLFTRSPSSGMPILFRMMRVGGCTGAAAGPLCGVVVGWWTWPADAPPSAGPMWSLLLPSAAAWMVLGVGVGVAVGVISGCIAGLLAESKHQT